MAHIYRTGGGKRELISHVSRGHGCPVFSLYSGMPLWFSQFSASSPHLHCCRFNPEDDITVVVSSLFRARLSFRPLPRPVLFAILFILLLTPRSPDRVFNLPCLPFSRLPAFRWEVSCVGRCGKYKDSCGPIISYKNFLKYCLRKE